MLGSCAENRRQDDEARGRGTSCEAGTGSRGIKGGEGWFCLFPALSSVPPAVALPQERFSPSPGRSRYKPVTISSIPRAARFKLDRAWAVYEGWRPAHPCQ